MLTSTLNERQPRTMCAYKEGESIPSIERMPKRLRLSVAAHVERWGPYFSIIYMQRRTTWNLNEGLGRDPYKKSRVAPW